MELELELEVSYNDKRCLVERAERRIGATDVTDGDRVVGCGVSVGLSTTSFFPPTTPFTWLVVRQQPTTVLYTQQCVF